MKTAIDTCVLSALLSVEPRTEQATHLLSRCRQEGSLVIAPFVFAELHAYPGSSRPFVRSFLERTEISVDYDLSSSLWALAGERYARYADRRRVSGGGESRRLLADFCIGAHASLHADRLLTFDTRIFTTYFPELALYPLPAL